MKLTLYDEFNFIHDNTTRIRYAICEYDSTRDRGLRIVWTCGNIGEYDADVFRPAMKNNFDHYLNCLPNDIKITVISYSDLMKCGKINNLCLKPHDDYDYIVIDFYK